VIPKCKAVRGQPPYHCELCGISTNQLYIATVDYGPFPPSMWLESESSGYKRFDYVSLDACKDCWPFRSLILTTNTNLW
jgi:hypothetical protein